RPLLITRVERKAKRLIHRVRPSTGRAGPPRAFDLKPVYSAAASLRYPSRGAPLGDALRGATEPGQAIDAAFGALALAIAYGDRGRAEGLLAFLGLCYVSADLDAGTARMGRHLQECDLVPGSRLAALEYNAGWSVLMEGVRQQAVSMAGAGPRPERRLGFELLPRRVVLRINGGLGNQLFQYAAALAYARRVGAPLRLDLFNYGQPTAEREFLLGRLRVPIRRASSFDVLSTRLRPHRERWGVRDDFMFGDNGSAWLSGLWEDQAYFAEIAPLVRRRFRPRDESTAEASRDLVRRARRGDGPVIGVHLRRGDRGPGGRAFSPFSSLPARYYQQAASRFPTDANFLVFSDTPEDIAWCREHLGLGDSAHVTFGEGRDPILDMFALTECDHVILSAGTFSWWAGYLGERAGRRVIVPNPLQGLSVGRVMIPCPMPSQPGWEEVTIAPGDG
ncbi:MAG: alpha-1,2-fucosyltransferase, partial [bacterium]